MKMVEVQDLVAALAANRSVAEPQRKKAVQTLAALQPLKHAAMLTGLLADARENFDLREQVVNALAVTGDAKIHVILVGSLQAAPARLQKAIALGLAGSKVGGQMLLEAVSQGKASARLLQDQALQVRLHQARLADLDKRLKDLTRGLPAPEARLQELTNQRRQGYLAARADPALGAKVFAKHCAACHQIANQGSKIGPQLDGIGIRGLDRILEDILDPNRNVDQAFRATVLTLKNGRLVTGLFLRQDGEVLVMADNLGKEVRVPRSEVEERAVSPLSPMPASLVEQVPEGDFYHLLGFLLAQRSQK